MKLDTALYLLAFAAALGCYSACQSSPPEVEDEVALPVLPKPTIVVVACEPGWFGCER